MRSCIYGRLCRGAAGSVLGYRGRSKRWRTQGCPLNWLLHYLSPWFFHRKAVGLSPPVLVSTMRHVPQEHSLVNHTEQHDPHGGDCWPSRPRSASSRRGVNGEKALTTSPPETGKPTSRGLRLRLPRADPPSCDIADAPVTERGDKGCAGQRDATGDGTDGSAPCEPAQLGDSGEELRGGERDAAGEAGADAI